MNPEKTPFPYPGGKSLYADWIIEKFPEHKCYVEVFGGAAGVLVSKSPSDIEVYNDYDESVANIFRVLRDRPDELIAWLNDQPYSKADYDRMMESRREGEDPDDPVEWAAREFYLRYSHFGARLEVGRSNFRRSIDSDLAGRFRRAVDALNVFRERFSDVIVECDDWETIVEAYDSPDTFFYMDPPYPDADNRHYDDHSIFDHARLVDRLDDIEGLWLLSYGEDPPEGLDGYPMVERSRQYTMNRGQDENELTGVERLFSNFDPQKTSLFRSSMTADPSEW